jgi:hypothetical protein
VTSLNWTESYITDSASHLKTLAARACAFDSNQLSDWLALPVQYIFGIDLGCFNWASEARCSRFYDLGR